MQRHINWILIGFFKTSADHAATVCMSVNKLMCRIVAPDDVLDSGVSSEDEMIKSLHDYTYGMYVRHGLMLNVFLHHSHAALSSLERTSDPLTQFAVVFSALIHDVDHDGEPEYCGSSVSFCLLATVD